MSDGVVGTVGATPAYPDGDNTPIQSVAVEEVEVVADTAVAEEPAVEEVADAPAEVSEETVAEKPAKKTTKK